MAKGICPNLSDPQIKAEFDEMVAALGEKQAYAIWDMNNGYSLDKAPNGEPSVLFETLLEHNNQNRVNALQAKAKVYTNSFKAWFGDWVNPNAKDVSKVVDKNGEPLVVYHYSGQQIEEFKESFPENYFAKHKGGTDRAIFFTDNSNPKGSFLADRPYNNPVYLSLKDVREKHGTKDNLRESGEDFVDTVNIQGLRIYLINKTLHFNNSLCLRQMKL